MVKSRRPKTHQSVENVEQTQLTKPDRQLSTLVTADLNLDTHSKKRLDRRFSNEENFWVGGCLNFE